MGSSEESSRSPDERVWDFVSQFLLSHDLLLSNLIRMHLIPNRYAEDDVKQYIGLRIWDILKRRGFESIKNPDGYFKSCLGYYIREFQREHGYTVGLPRRPREYCEQDDLEARSKKYKYLDLLSSDEFSSLVYDDQPCIEPTETWHLLTGLLTNDQAAVLDCVIRRSMTWVETSNLLGIPQSTCWFRKQQAFLTIFNAVESMSGTMAETVKIMLRHPEELDLLVWPGTGTS